MDWEKWQPKELAALCFVCRDGEVLLIHKKRGLGAGKINAPGGRLEPGETSLDAAIRETEEELRVTPRNLVKRGDLHFQFSDGYSLTCAVYFADSCEGVPEETEEAIPKWTRLEEIPYDRMWEDDRHWLPGALAGRTFIGYFLFDGEIMLSMDLRWDGKVDSPGNSSPTVSVPGSSNASQMIGQ